MRGRGRGRTMSTTDEDPDKMVKNSWTPEVRSFTPSRVSPARDASGARGAPLNRREVISLLPRLREEGRRRAASRSIAIETPNSAYRVHPAHCPHPQTQEDVLLREQIDKHGGPGNWTAIAEALVGRSSKSCRLRCARPRTHPRARDAAGIAVRSPRPPPVISRRAARAFPGLILERRPPPPPRVPSRPFPFSNQPLAFVPILVIPSEHTQVVQPAQPHGEARAVHRRGGQGNPRRACRVRQQVGGHLPRYPRQVRQRRARPAAHARTKIQHARYPSRDSVRSFRRATLNRRFVVHAPQPGTFARFFETPLADLPIAFAGKPRSRLFGLAFSPIGRMSVFRITRPRRRLKLKGRASVETRGVFVFRTRDRRRDARRTYGARSSSYVRRYVSIELDDD